MTQVGKEEPKANLIDYADLQITQRDNLRHIQNIGYAHHLLKTTERARGSDNLAPIQEIDN